LYILQNRVFLLISLSQGVSSRSNTTLDQGEYMTMPFCRKLGRSIVPHRVLSREAQYEKELLAIIIAAFA